MGTLSQSHLGRSLTDTTFISCPESSFQVLQSPQVLALMHLNASAEISCSSTSHQISALQGLSLRRKFSGGIRVFYQHRPMDNGLQTVHKDFEGRISVTRSPSDCCTFTFQLSLLQKEDTDGYYCSWEFFNRSTADVHYQSSNYTLVIVRGEDMLHFLVGVTNFSLKH